jgi:hypothetical protein
MGAPKKFKNQLRPLVRPGSVNFCQNYLSHETVHFNKKNGNTVHTALGRLHFISGCDRTIFIKSLLPGELSPAASS